MSDSSFPVKPLLLDLALVESDFVECVDPYGYWEDFAAHQLKCDCTPLE